MHMGIFRNPPHFMSRRKQHARISAHLHAFAAKTILEKYTDARYMVTTPLSSMANIFKTDLPKDSFAEGMNKDGSWIEQSGSASSDKGYRFVLYDRNISDENKQPVLLINDENKEQYDWILRRLHGSLDAHPYFVVRLIDLSQILKSNW